jgi:hypothetical protein
VSATLSGPTRASAQPAAGLADLGPCPFCGLHIAADPDHGIVSHALPTCARFDRLDATAFIVAVRRRRESGSRAEQTRSRFRA